MDRKPSFTYWQQVPPARSANCWTSDAKRNEYKWSEYQLLWLPTTLAQRGRITKKATLPSAALGPVGTPETDMTVARAAMATKALNFIMNCELFVDKEENYGESVENRSTKIHHLFILGATLSLFSSLMQI